MSTKQKTLFDELEEVAKKESIAKPHPRFDMSKYYSDYLDTDTEHEEYVVGSSGNLVFPCVIARALPIGDERCKHINSCVECQRLIKEFDKIAYG